MPQHIVSNDRVLLPSTEACNIAGFTRQHMQRLLRDGIIEGVKPGRDWLVYEDSLQSFLAKPRKPGPKGPHKKSPEEHTQAEVDAQDGHGSKES